MPYDANYDDFYDFTCDCELDDCEDCEDFEDNDYDCYESMDGDHDSAMESAGWGTDEDYGYYGEDF